MLHNNIKLILSLAQQNIDAHDGPKEIKFELQQKLDYVKGALYDIQHDNFGQLVIYTGVFDKDHWGYVDEDPGRADREAQDAAPPMENTGMNLSNMLPEVNWGDEDKDN